jgi:hypothetical protein
VNHFSTRTVMVILMLALLALLVGCSQDREASTAGSGAAPAAQKTAGAKSSDGAPTMAREEAKADDAAPAPALDAVAEPAPEAPTMGRIGGGGEGASGASKSKPAPRRAKREAPAKAAPKGLAEGRAEVADNKVAPADRDAEADEAVLSRKDRARRQAPAPQARQLTAGEWRDLDHWDFWRELFDGGQQLKKGPWERMERYWRIYTNQRIPVKVTTQGRAVTNAHVKLYDKQQRLIWQARTDNLGRAQVFAGAFDQKSDGPFSLQVESGGATASAQEITVRRNQVVNVELPSAAAAPSGLDVMFVVDTTGSMGDELAYLKSELTNVIDRVQKQNGQQLSIRTSVNFFRDHGDEYVVRSFPFEAEVSRTQAHIKDQYASGGGDFPEAVEEALGDAVFKHQWRQQARSRLLFLVLDAPPHSKPETYASLQEAIQEAARQGVQIIPIVGSGIDKPTEFLMRQLAVTTNGSYIFLTDDSGIGGSHLKPTIGPHKVEFLNNLLVRVINRSLSTQ